MSKDNFITWTEEEINEGLAEINSAGYTLARKVQEKLPLEKITEAIQVEPDSFDKVTDAIAYYGEVLESNECSAVGIIGSGIGGLNPVFISAKLISPETVVLEAYAKEGAVKQHSANKGLEKIKQQIADNQLKVEIPGQRKEEIKKPTDNFVWRYKVLVIAGIIGMIIVWLIIFWPFGSDDSVETEQPVATEEVTEETEAVAEDQKVTVHELTTTLPSEWVAQEGNSKDKKTYAKYDENGELDEMFSLIYSKEKDLDEYSEAMYKDVMGWTGESGQLSVSESSEPEDVSIPGCAAAKAFSIKYHEDFEGNTLTYLMDGVCVKVGGDIFYYNGNGYDGFYSEEDFNDFINNSDFEKYASNQFKYLKGKDLLAAKTVLKEQGYTGTYIFVTSGADYSGYVNDDIMSSDELKNYIITGVSVDTDSQTAEIEFNSKTNIDNANKDRDNEEELSSKLLVDEAWVALEVYGKKQFPDGFSAKYGYGDKLAEKAIDADTWFLKSKCVVKVDGVKYNKTVEAEVSGTNDHPVVSNFEVY